jgi:hypothetical protein
MDEEEVSDRTGVGVGLVIGREREGTGEMMAPSKGVNSPGQVGTLRRRQSHRRSGPQS